MSEGVAFGPTNTGTAAKLHFATVPPCLSGFIIFYLSIFASFRHIDIPTLW
jgi:hypothetical protein